MTTLRYLYFPGCQLNTRLPQYDLSVRTIMAQFDVTLYDREMNCCGYPVRHQDLTASVLAAARNLAVAAREGLAALKELELQDRERQIREAEATIEEMGERIFHLINSFLGALLDLLGGLLDLLGVLHGLADTHIDGDLGDARDFHHILVAKLLLQFLDHFITILIL
mgnify:CR=1 FL=1